MKACEGGNIRNALRVIVKFDEMNKEKRLFQVTKMLSVDRSLKYVPLQPGHKAAKGVMPNATIAYLGLQQCCFSDECRYKREDDCGFNDMAYRHFNFEPAWFKQRKEYSERKIG